MIIKIHTRVLEIGYTQELNYSENIKIMVHMNMGVSQLLHMYITSLIIMAYNIIIMKNHMLKISNMKACKLNEKLEIVTKTNRANL